MDTYKDIWEKDEDEILDFFHEITEPLNEMKIELEEKLNASKKIWMSDEEKLDLRICLDSVKQIFKGMEPSDLRGIVGGVLEFEADEDDEVEVQAVRTVDDRQREAEQTGQVVDLT